MIRLRVSKFCSRLLKMGNIFTEIRPQEKVTKFLDLQVQLLYVLGLFRLPPRVTHNSKHDFHCLHTLYMGFVFTFFAIFLVFNTLCVYIDSSQNFADFFTKSVENLGVTFLFFEIIIFNKNAEGIMRILSLMNKFDFTRNKRIFYIFRKLERLAFVIFVVSIMFVALSVFIGPILPIEGNKEVVQKVHGFKYPLNRLPLRLWLPFLDPSEPYLFHIILSLEMYLGLLCITVGLMNATFYPFILLHLCGQHFVLSNQLKLLGKSTLYIPRRRTCSRSYRHHLKKECEIREMKKCIIFHQKLVHFRALVSLMSISTAYC